LFFLFKILVGKITKKRGKRKRKNNVSFVGRQKSDNEKEHPMARVLLFSKFV